MPPRTRPVRELIIDEAYTQLHAAPQEAVNMVVAVGDVDGVVGCLRSQFLELGVGTPYQMN